MRINQKLLGDADRQGCVASMEGYSVTSRGGKAAEKKQTIRASQSRGQVVCQGKGQEVEKGAHVMPHAHEVEFSSPPEMHEGA